MAERGTRPVACGLGAGVFFILVGAAVVWPAIAVFTTSAAGAESVDLALLLRSLGVAALIALLATLAALPSAWVIRSARAPTILLLVAPMLLPAYLAYTGWGVLRAPDTALGKWLMMGPRGAGPGESNWYPTAAGYLLAVLGLALWAWPLAAIILGARLRRVDEAVLEALSLDVRSRTRRTLEVLWMSRRALAAAVGIVGLVMLGSAVPLHLSQLDTYAIKVWRVLDQTPRDQQGRVWVSAWPLMAIGLLGALRIATRLLALDSEESAPKPRTARTLGLVTAAIWCAGVAAPVILLLANVRNWRSLGTFLRLIRDPFFKSGVVSLAIAAITAVLAAWTWMSLSGRWRRLFLGLGGLLMISGLVPGILVGSATAQAWTIPNLSFPADSLAIVILAHFARFGMLGVLAGWWLAATEGRWARDLRTIDAGSSLKGWWETALAPQSGVIAAAAIAAGLLSFHEIESTVMVQPASATGGSFSWQMLQWLHFARMDELAIGVLVVVGVGVAGMVAVWAAFIASRYR